VGYSTRVSENIFNGKSKMATGFILKKDIKKIFFLSTLLTYDTKLPEKSHKT
jgi:hypothetical protein